MSDPASEGKHHEEGKRVLHDIYYLNSVVFAQSRFH
jgi:hypothetical protein